jgi:hypothetical protein
MRCGGYQRSNSCSRGNSCSRKLKRGRLRRIWVPILTGTEAWLLQQFSGSTERRISRTTKQFWKRSDYRSRVFIFCDRERNEERPDERGVEEILARGGGEMFYIAMFGNESSRLFRGLRARWPERLRLFP